ncbi:uncharacterized protein O3C94_016588 [Discoglossus pictus]
MNKVEKVLETLRRVGLTANPVKCALGLTEIKYLGYTVDRGLIKPQLNKVDAIQGWPRPLRKRQVRAFLGIVGYYRRVIPGFASIAAPLTDLTRQRAPDTVQWNPEAERAFEDLKVTLCHEPILIA